MPQINGAVTTREVPPGNWRMPSQACFLRASAIDHVVDVVASIRESLDMELMRVAPIRNRPYWIGVAAIALVLLLAFIAPQLWRATLPRDARDNTGPGESSAEASAGRLNGDQPSADGSSTAQPSSTTPPPSTTPSVSVLTVSIAPELFDEPGANGGGRGPFSEESGAEEFAFGVVEEVVERGNSKYLPLKLTKVFVGRLPAGTFLAEDRMVVRIECSLPPMNLGTRSQIYKVGSKVVVYLSRDDAKRWLVTSLVPITPGSEEHWGQRLQTFADIMLAPESDDPEKRFRELLVPQPKGGLEFTLHCAVSMHPHPAARPVVRELWRERVKQHPIDPEEIDIVGTMSLTYLMRNLRESEMLDEILEHAMRQRPGHRGTYIWELRIQAEYANTDARNRLQARLRKLLDDSPALEALDSVKDGEMWGDVSNTIQALQHLETLEPKPKRP